MKSLEWDTFAECANLIKVSLPSTLTSIETFAFSNCKRLDSIILPDNVTDIQFCAFSNTNLKEIICQAPIPPGIDISSFTDYTYNESQLKVHSASISKYQQDEIWCNFKNITSIESTPTLVSSILLNPSTRVGKKGENFIITATIKPDDATNKNLKWLSDDENVATVDETGIVSILNDGYCIITASSTDGSNITAECFVTSETSGDRELHSDIEGEFDILNTQGLLLHKNVSNKDLSGISSGIYIIRQGNAIKKVVVK